MNTFNCIGNITRDPETRQAGRSSVTSFSIAHNRKWTDKDTGELKEETSFFDCEAWGPRGETIAKHFSRGSKIGITGELKQDRWEDKDDGTKRSKIIVRVNSFDFCDSKGGSGSGSGGDDIDFG